MSETGNLSLFFEPQRVAVVGSLRKGYFGGYVVIKTLLEGGFRGKIFAVNPSYRNVLGLKVYPSLEDIHEGIDLVLLIVNRKSVPELIRTCTKQGVKAAVIVADGFAERDEEGARLQREIVGIAKKCGLRLLGPNTAGVANPNHRFIPDPYEMGYRSLKPGGTAICAQTGMINPQAFPYSDLRYGVSKICDFGNKCDVDECDLLEYLEGDFATRVISMYLESIGDGRRFLDISKKVSPKKPILILKSGRTRQGAKMSASHTGSLAVDDQIFQAACKQAGIIRLDTFSELFELPKIFDLQPLPKGRRLGIVTFTGGVGVLAIDEAAKYGLTVSKFSSITRARLSAIFSGLRGTVVDLGPAMAAMNNYMDAYSKILTAVFEDETVDCLLNIIWTSPFESFVDAYIRFYDTIKAKYQKTVATWIYGPSLRLIRKMAARMEDLGFPVFSAPEVAIKALGIAYQYTASRKGGGRWERNRPSNS